ncbi:hypothetical protein K438DRAFT_1774515 [Mycena galopus ATCC 62051]|nr:hypothetical protein K438DRAFT_1774515 [Mycena galopus ATCC 62051]
MGDSDSATYHAYAYFHAKAANVLVAIKLSKRSGGRINAYSLCPGREFPKDSIAIIQDAGFLGADKKPNTEKFGIWKTIPQGAATTRLSAAKPRGFWTCYPPPNSVHPLLVKIYVIFRHRQPRTRVFATEMQHSEFRARPDTADSERRRTAASRRAAHLTFNQSPSVDPMTYIT